MKRQSKAAADAVVALHSGAGRGMMAQGRSWEVLTIAKQAYECSAALPDRYLSSAMQINLRAQGSEGLIAGRGWLTTAIALCSRLAAWRVSSSPTLSVWSVKALQAWAVLEAQLCFPTSGLPWGPHC